MATQLQESPGLAEQCSPVRTTLAYGVDKSIEENACGNMIYNYKPSKYPTSKLKLAYWMECWTDIVTHFCWYLIWGKITNSVKAPVLSIQCVYGQPLS